MKQDEKLHRLLTNYGMQEPSVEFDDKLMQKIAAVKFKKQASQQLINRSLKYILIAVFALVIVALFIVAFLVQPNVFTNYFFISLSAKTYAQVFSFFAAFWIVMSLNIWWQYRNAVNFQKNNILF